MLDLWEVARELTELDGPVGHEGPVADAVERHWARSCERVRRTPVGNVVAELGGSGPRLLLQAHLDEIGMLVEAIDEQGFLRLTSCHPGARTYHLRECLNRAAFVHTDRGVVEGVFGCLTGHLRIGSPADDRAPTWDDAFVDLGLGSRDAVLAAGVRPGCPVLYRAAARRVGDRLVMKAADDRIGLVVMTAFAAAMAQRRAELAHEVVLAATVQEEAGAVGAASIRADVGAFDAALAFEVAPAGDVPGAPPHARAVRLGGGPCLVHKDASVHYDAALGARVAAAADAAGIALQHAVYPAFGTDGSALLRQGIPTALVGVPTRYTHSPHEMVDEADVRACVALVEAFCTTAPG